MISLRDMLRIANFTILTALVGLALIFLIYVEPPRSGEQTLFIHAAHWESVVYYSYGNGRHCLDWNKGTGEPVKPPTGDLCVPPNTSYGIHPTVYRYFVDGHLENSVTTMTYQVDPDAWDDLYAGKRQILTFVDGVVVDVRDKREVGQLLEKLSDLTTVGRDYGHPE